MMVLIQSVEIIVAACPVTLPCVLILPLCRILLVINQASIQSIVIIVIISPFLFFVVVFMVLFFVVLVFAVLFFVAVVHWTMSSSLHGWLPVEPGGQCWRVILDLTFFKFGSIQYTCAFRIVKHKWATQDVDDNDVYEELEQSFCTAPTSWSWQLLNLVCIGWSWLWGL